MTKAFSCGRGLAIIGAIVALFVAVSVAGWSLVYAYVESEKNLAIPAWFAANLGILVLCGKLALMTFQSTRWPTAHEVNEWIDQ